MENIKRLKVSVVFIGSFLAGFAMPTSAMQALDDQTLRDETGQAAFYTNYAAPSGSGTGATTSDFGFYTLGVQGKVDINANIQHLQLGCGGVNGPGCDIDINNLSLSGNPGTGSCPSGAARASCDATLTNPFLRLAIKTPNVLATRQVVGLQLGAQQASGLLTTGTDNGLTPNGINSLSGYLHVQSTSAANTLTGTIATAPGFFDASDPNNRITGALNALVLGLPAANAKFALTGGGFWVPGFSGINFSVAGPTINSSRVTGITVNPVVGLPPIALGFNTDDNTCGGLASSPCNTNGNPVGGYPSGANTQPSSTALAGTQGGAAIATVTSCTALGFLPCSLVGINNGDQYNVHMYGKVSNIVANVAFTQPLGMIHSLPINSPLSLSLQSQSVLWPGAPADAQKGWWLAATDPVYLGNLVPSNPVSLCQGGTGNPAMCVFPQIAQQVSAYLAANNPSTADVGTLLINKSGALAAAIGNVALSPLSLAINGVQLASQNIAPNCYGSLKFC